MSDGKVTAFLVLARKNHLPYSTAPPLNRQRCGWDSEPWPCQPYRMIGAVEAALGLHRPHAIYDECGHDHADDEPGAEDLIRVDEIGLVCSDGFRYRICRECCTSGAPNWHQTEECADEHDHGEGKPICRTCAAIAAELTGEGKSDD